MKMPGDPLISERGNLYIRKELTDIHPLVLVADGLPLFKYKGGWYVPMRELLDWYRNEENLGCLTQSGRELQAQLIRINDEYEAKKEANK